MDIGRGSIWALWSLGSQIPDTAPCLAWLAIVCFTVVAGVFCAVLFSNVFEGSSRRVENPTDAAPSDAKGLTDSARERHGLYAMPAA
jgi:hypothetical protein